LDYLHLHEPCVFSGRPNGFELPVASKLRRYFANEGKPFAVLPGIASQLFHGN